MRSPGSFGGIRNLRRYGKQSVREAKKFLAYRDAYTLHKPRRIRFPRRKTYSKGIADLFQIDLVDLSNLASFNDGMRYLLLVAWLSGRTSVFGRRTFSVLRSTCS